MVYSKWQRNRNIAMYKRILVPVDGSATSLLGLGEAIKLAETSGATLRIVHVVNEFLMDQGYVPAPYYQRMIESLRDHGKKVVSEGEALAREHAVQCQGALLETVGRGVCDLIIEQAKQWPADLIVMGTHGRRGMRRLALGSDAEMVLRSSPVPVLFIRDQTAAA